MIHLDTSDDPNEPEPRCGVCGLPHSYCECEQGEELPFTEYPEPVTMLSTGSTHEYFYSHAGHEWRSADEIAADALRRYGYPASVIGQPHVSGLSMGYYTPGRLVSIMHF